MKTAANDNQPELTAERLRELLDYDSATGEFRWKISKARRVKVGLIAGCLRSDGYRKIVVDGRLYLTHRLVWLYVHGTWPPHEIDHIDFDKANNRIDNLRLATHRENACNKRLRANNTSGYKGVFWDKRAGKWFAQISKDGKEIYLGLSADPAEAHAVYVRAANDLHGQYARAA